ncbi:unnamed protein product [Acanthosepion pharaonis]|uniref:Uncharacterized protein n=1 Tax=Acanthosepion pharaonis TaxID=158019 RepID=A0A812CR98_ACAPH|nr:unnamed protein product [Sepia pharaonis]
MNAAIYPIYRRLHHVTQNDMIVNIAEKKRSLLSSSQQWTLCSMSFRKEWLPVSIAIQFEVIRIIYRCSYLSIYLYILSAHIYRFNIYLSIYLSVSIYICSHLTICSYLYIYICIFYLYLFISIYYIISIDICSYLYHYLYSCSYLSLSICSYLTYPSICVHIYMLISVISMHIYLSIYLYIFHIYLSYISQYLYTYLPIHICSYLCLRIYQIISVSLHIYLYLFISINPLIYLYLYLFISNHSALRRISFVRASVSFGFFFYFSDSSIKLSFEIYCNRIIIFYNLFLSLFFRFIFNFSLPLIFSVHLLFPLDQFLWTVSLSLSLSFSLLFRTFLFPSVFNSVLSNI